MKSFLLMHQAFRGLLSAQTLALPPPKHAWVRSIKIASKYHAYQKPYVRKPFESISGYMPKTVGTAKFFAGTVDNSHAMIDFSSDAQIKTNIEMAQEKRVDVHDIRYMEPPASLSVEGCELVYSPTGLRESDLLNHSKDEVDATVKSSYFHECANLVKRKTGASKAIPYNYRHRQLKEGEVLDSPDGYSSKPLVTFHMDNDRETAEANLKRALSPEEADYWLSRNWGIINVWRPIGDTVFQYPLGLIDSTSADLVHNAVPIFTKNNYKDHFTALRFDPNYRFYYASRLTPDEAMLFVDFDSKHSPGLSGLAHGAFRDHASPDNAPLRRSIEVRVLVLYDE